MNLDDLCELSGQALKDISDAEFLKFFEEKGYLKVTRPEQAVKPQQRNQPQPVYIKPEKRKAMAKMEELGIDLSFMYRRKKK